MKRYDELLINKLLDSYEGSARYSESNIKNQRIFFNFTNKNIPEYFDEQSIIYEVINQQVMDLEYKELIEILWKNKKVGHIIEKIALNIDKLDKAYLYAKRKQKRSLEAEVLEILERFTAREATLDAFIVFIKDRIHENKPVKKYFELDDLKYIEDLLTAVQAVVSNKEEVYIRELSMKIFKDSKTFEGMEGKIKNIIVEFHPNKKYLLEAEDLFCEFNILKNPSYVMIKGVGTVRFKNSTMDLRDIDNGIGISSADLSILEFVNCLKVKKLITIENLTTFHRFKDDQAIIIYLGGYHNESRRELLKKLYMVYPDIEFYHWGDIDCGGFRIYKHLKEQTGIPFLPMNMGIDILKKYCKFTKHLTQTDTVALTAMKEDPGFSIFHEIIDLMLRDVVKLEQEIVALRYIKEPHIDEQV